MLDEESANPIIDSALARLGVASERRADFAWRVRNVGIMASFRLSPGAGVDPEQIVKALEGIEGGLKSIAVGLATIDAACRTTGARSEKRADSLAEVQRVAIGAIADAILRRIPAAQVTDEQLADAMPEYGYLSFRNSWNGAFGDAAAKVSAARAAYSRDDFRRVKETPEWLCRAVGSLAEIYFDATGRKPSSASPGDRQREAKPGSRLPFPRFVADVWPLLALQGEPVPDSKTILSAHTRARILPPMPTG